MATDVDELDRQILDLVQDDCRASADLIAHEVGLSPSAVTRRLARLRASGAIEREVAIVRPEAVGRPLLVIVAVEVENEHQAVAQAFREQIRKAPEVMQCFYVTGAADYLLLCALRDMEEYEAFAQRVFTANPNVSRFITSVVMRAVKTGLKVSTS